MVNAKPRNALLRCSLAGPGGRSGGVLLLAWVLGVSAAAAGAVWGDLGDLFPQGDGPCAIHGRVKNDQGAGIPCAVVTALGQNRFFRSFTDGNGDFTLAGLPPGDYRIQFYARDFMDAWYDGKPDQASADVVRLAEGQPAPEIGGALIPLALIRGQVRDRAGVAAAGVPVKLYRDGLLCAQTTTDGQGNYLFWAVWPGGYTIHFQPDYSSDFTAQWYEGRRDSASADELTVPAGRETVLADAVLDRYGQMSGTVRDQAGAPAPGVTVEARRDEESNAYVSYCASTDAEGRYFLRRLPAGTYRVEFQPWENENLLSQYFCGKGEWATADRIPMLLNQVVNGIDARLDAGGVIAGTVTDPQGTPLAGISVCVVHPDDFYLYPSSLCATTDEDGKYSIGALRTGNWLVEFQGSHAVGFLDQWHPGAPHPQLAQPVAVGPGQTVTGVDARMAKACSISGRVVDSQGNGVKDGYLRMYGNELDPYRYVTSTTAEGGFYTFNGLYPGVYRCRFFGAAGELHQAAWYPGVQDPSAAGTVGLAAGQSLWAADFVVATGVCLSGQVQDLQGGALSGAQIYAYDGWAQRVASAQSSADGTFSLCGVPPGEIRLWWQFPPELTGKREASQAGGWYDRQTSYATADRILATDQSVGGLRLIASPGGALMGFVTSPAGQGLGSVMVYLHEGCFGLASAITSGGGYPEDLGGPVGWFEVTGLPAGTFQVQAVNQNAGRPTWYDHRVDQQSADPVVLAAGETAFLVLGLDPCGPSPAPTLWDPEFGGDAWRIRWNNLGVYFYELQEARTLDFADPVTVFTEDTTAWFDHDPPLVGEYYYRLRAWSYCLGQWQLSAWSSTAVVVPDHGRRRPSNGGSAERVNSKTSEANDDAAK